MSMLRIMPLLRPFQLQVENVLSSLCILLSSVYRFKGGYKLKKIVGVCNTEKLGIFYMQSNI